MIIDEALRLIAGLVVLISLALATWVSPMWLWLTVFVAANLIQSAFTRWCPMITLLKMTGMPETRQLN
ncbi:Uncharacterised protein [BD1-7 clade bacterium]|uniref:Inner membrane protein YgaP-like transmembrane domain-containing protein n=1 Tax=BD1-7 clade bacterium TaxID=2029982 RepID=A0A5S9P6N5_9GAMM|nr:Uncharacterised protein [BD1-7 clade bacterium]CAA0099264.1 Uncharacterised protein [BD1-7 clade bacterium]